MRGRKALVVRKTGETDIRVEFCIDGQGKSQINTPIPFMNHMLTLFSKHGLFDINIEARGDIEVDDHHTLEDLGIVMGKALVQALGNMRGIRRYGSILLPMDEALASVSLDICGRPFLVYNVSLPRRSRIKNFDMSLIEDFFRGLITHSGMTLHVNLQYGRNVHHIFEAIFKGFARALDEATSIDKRIKGVPSTKGRID